MSKTKRHAKLLFILALIITISLSDGYPRRRRRGRTMPETDENGIEEPPIDELGGIVDPENPDATTDDDIDDVTTDEGDVTRDDIIDETTTDDDIDGSTTDDDYETTTDEGGVVVEPSTTDDYDDSTTDLPFTLPPPPEPPAPWCKSAGKTCNDHIECCEDLQCYKYYNFKKGVCLDAEQWEEYRRRYSRGKSRQSGSRRRGSRRRYG